MCKTFIQRLSLVSALCLASSSFVFSQEIVIEWQSPPGSQAISAFQDGLIPRAAMLDYNGDGLNELTGVTGSGQFRVIDGATQQVLAQTSQVGGLPMNRYRFFGFADMAGSTEKELIFVPRFDLQDPVVFNEIDVGTGSVSQGTAYTCPANDSIYWICSSLVGWDADPYQEFAFYSPAGGYLVVGNGYSAGVQSPVAGPIEQFGPVTACNDLAIDWISSPNVSWPTDEENFLPEGANDFNGDGIDDLAIYRDSLFYIFDPLTQATLLSGRLPAAAWSVSSAPAPRVVGYFDFCGSGQKQILIGWPTVNRSNIPMHRLRDLMILTPPPDGLLDSFTVYYPTEVLADLTANPELFAGRAVADPDQDGKMELVMQHRTNRRLVSLELLDSNNVQPPVVISEATFSPPGTTSHKTLTDYEVVLKWETGPGLRPYIDLSRQLDRGQLDFNGDETVDLVVWQENSTDTTAIGCKVFDLQSQSLLWDFDFPADEIGDTLRRFHGFHDVNADGEKEAILGSRTIVTQDETIHQPFGEFRIFAVLDMDSDGFADVVGQTPDGRLQVWGAGAVNSVQGTTGTPDFALSLFPNPAVNDRTQLELTTQQAGTFRWQLLDQQGRLLRETNLGHLTPGGATYPVDGLSELPSGVYFVRIVGPTGTRSVRLLLS